MTPHTTGRRWFAQQARATGAPDLPQHAIDELAAHLEDIYTEAHRQQAGASRGVRRRSRPRSPNQPLGDRSRVRAPASRKRGRQRRPPGGGWTGLGGDVRFAWRQWRRSPSFAAVAILDARPRRRRRHRDLQRRRHRPAAAAALPAAGAARRDLGEQRREGAAEGTALAGQLHGLPRRSSAAFCGRGRVVAPRSEPRRARAASPSASARSRRAPTSFSCSAYRPQLGPGFPSDGPFYSRDLIAVISDRLWRQRYNADPVDRRQDARA